MTSRDFRYWLQGYFELRDDNPPADNWDGLTDDQVKTVKKHLNLVFIHEIDPSFGDDREKLVEEHNKDDEDEECGKAPKLTKEAREELAQRQQNQQRPWGPSGPLITC